VTEAVGQVPGTLLDWAAAVIGISPAIVRAQIQLESNGDPDALSSTGAVGVAQFEPGTWAGQGCPGSPNNVNDAMHCYAGFMHSLVSQYKGNVRDALAAYNAGGGDLAAGYGYADTILANAGEPQDDKAGKGTGDSGTGGGATLDSANPGGGTPCLILVPYGVGCVFTKANARAIIGGLCLAGGALLMLPGIIIIAAAGFRGSGVPGAAAAAAGPLEATPGYGHAIRYARDRSRQRQAAAQGAAQGRAAATRSAARRTARKAAPAGP
jgi:hypothetical protein